MPQPGRPSVDPSFALATWIAGDHIVTISGSTTVPELITIARTVHQVSDEEWNGMKFQADLRSADNNRLGNFDQSQPVVVASGTDTKGNDWVVRVSTLTFANEQRTQWQGNDDASAYESRADNTARINTVVNNDRTYVFAELPPRSRANRAAADRPRRSRPRSGAVRRRRYRVRSNLRGLCLQRAGELHRADHRCRRRCACRLAGNVKAEPAPDLIEMIEMIDDSADPFADRRAVAPTDAPAVGGPRWLGPAAAAVLLAVVGYGVVSSTIDSNKPPAPAAAKQAKPQFYVGNAADGVPDVPRRATRRW